MRTSPPPPAVATVLLAVLLLAGCGTPPGLAETPPPLPAGTATPRTTGPSGFTPVFPTAPLPSGGFASDTAVSCAGDPDGDDLVAVLRDRGVLAAGAEVTVAEGPLCAGDWQYTVVTMPDVDPLQVVTRRGGDGLELVTAGTDVCTVEVEVRAPPAILATAGCVG